MKACDVRIAYLVGNWGMLVDWMCFLCVFVGYDFFLCCFEVTCHGYIVRLVVIVFHNIGVRLGLVSGASLATLFILQKEYIDFQF